MCRYLVVGLNKGGIEAEQGFERHTRNERRVRDIVDVVQEVVLHFWESNGRSKFEQQRKRD